MADAEGYTVTHEPFNFTDGYETQSIVQAAIVNSDGFVPQDEFIADVKVTWDVLCDKDMYPPASIERQHQSVVSAVYATTHKAVIRCELIELGVPVNTEDANRLIRATKITLGRLGIDASMQLLNTSEMP